MYLGIFIRFSVNMVTYKVLAMLGFVALLICVKF